MLSLVVEFVSKAVLPLANSVCKSVRSSGHSSQVTSEGQGRLESVCKVSGPCILEGKMTKLGARRGNDECVSDGPSQKQPWAWRTRPARVQSDVRPSACRELLIVLGF